MRLNTDASTSRLRHKIGLLVCVLLLSLMYGASGCGAPAKQTSRLTGEKFEVYTSNQWKSFYIKGINLSLGLPGKHPGAFGAEAKLYRRYLDLIAKMNVNTIRVYTLQPPIFYKELLAYNKAHLDKPLWLMHGVWLDEASEKEKNYLASTITNESFKKEIDHVIDAIHGAADIQARYGWAYGRYSADVSPWTLGIILGREMDPYIVAETNKSNPTVNSFKGSYVSIQNATPIEVWATKIIEHTFAYEQENYSVQRPVAISNWATLDPLSHASEPKAPVSSEDMATMDLKQIQTTKENTGGVFISYHIYPYYPNFINIDPAFESYKDHIGPNPYEGYLKALKNHYKGFPIVAAEYGLPASMASVHTSSSKMNHGMIDEKKQADGCKRLTENIQRAGFAGGMLFAWMDEWFKRTWALDPLQAKSRIRIWHNMISPEENFGMVAIEAYRPKGTATIGDPKSWQPEQLISRKSSDKKPRKTSSTQAEALQLEGLKVQHDPAYLFLQLSVKNLDPNGDGKIEWSQIAYLIGIDTYDQTRGDSKIHKDLKINMKNRIEFRVRIQGNKNNEPQAFVEVIQPYDSYGIWHGVKEKNQVYRSIAVDEGKFNVMAWIMEDNLFDPKDSKRLLQKRQIFALGNLRYGHQVVKKNGYKALGQFYGNAASSTISVRIPWTLLHVTDPSKRQVMHDNPATPTFDHRQTEGFRFTIASIIPATKKEKAKLVDVLPGGPASKGNETKVPASALYTWDFWEIPEYKERIRPVYHTMQKAFAKMP